MTVIRGKVVTQKFDSSTNELEIFGKTLTEDLSGNYFFYPGKILRGPCIAIGDTGVFCCNNGKVCKEVISYLHPVPQQKSIVPEEEVFSVRPFQEYGFNILLRPQSREIDLYLGYIRLHSYPYSKEQLDSLVGYIGTNKVELDKLNYFVSVDVWGNEEAFAVGWHPKSIFHSAPVLNYREPLTPPMGVTEVARWLLDKFPLWEHVSFVYDRPTKVLTFTRNTL